MIDLGPDLQVRNVLFLKWCLYIRTSLLKKYTSTGVPFLFLYNVIDEAKGNGQHTIPQSS